MVIASGDSEVKPSIAIGKHILINNGNFPKGIFFKATYSNATDKTIFNILAAYAITIALFVIKLTKTTP